MTTAITMSVNNPTTLELVKRVLQTNGLNRPWPFVEIFWDNFTHLSPNDLFELLTPYSSQVALHLMWTRFLERTTDELEVILRRLRAHVEAINPIFISDHLCAFKVNNVRVPFAQEYDYKSLEVAASRIDRYQQVVGNQLLIENAASTHHPVAKQIDFIEQLIAQTGCGLLFDISNAVMGEQNKLGGFELWLNYLKNKSIHCHIGGYGWHADTNTFQDTHAHDISTNTYEALAELCIATDIKTLTYERDYRADERTCSAEVRKISTCLIEHTVSTNGL